MIALKRELSFAKTQEKGWLTVPAVDAGKDGGSGREGGQEGGQSEARRRGNGWR